MSEALVRLVSGRFQTYAAQFLDAPGDTFAYRLKIEHTNRVLAIAEGIASQEALPERLCLAARLAALMHDVGRFPQYRQYRTFRDADSANHAALSVSHALRQGLLAGVPTDIRRLVLGAVFLHNKRSLPSLASDELATVAQVVRDSDKLDIYSVMIAHFSQKNPKHPEVALNVLDEPDKYSDEVLDTLLNREHGDYRSIVYINDFKMMAIGWLYDLNFRSSCRMLQDKGYLDTLFDTLPRYEKILEFRRQIATDIAHKIKGA
ncbi:MAG: HD domain-containing protein [Desulfovibrio sp.]